MQTDNAGHDANLDQAGTGYQKLCHPDKVVFVKKESEHKFNILNACLYIILSLVIKMIQQDGFLASGPKTLATVTGWQYSQGFFYS